MNNPRSEDNSRSYVRWKIIFIGGLLSVCSSAFSQSTQNGFYFTVNCEQFSLKPHTVMLNKKIFGCLTAQPVVSVASFQDISELMVVPDQSYMSFFDVTVDNETYQRLSLIAASALVKELAFVVDEEIVFMYVVDPKNPIRMFRLMSYEKPKEVERVYNKLRKMVITPN